MRDRQRVIASPFTQQFFQRCAVSSVALLIAFALVVEIR